MPMATDYEALSAREFRYDQPRARYLVADYECNDSADPNDWSLVEGAVRWTEYEGVRPYADGAIEEDGSGGLTFARNLRYLCDGAAGDTGLTAQQTLIDADPDETTYLHGDLIDSSVMTTDDNGNSAGAATTAYTAFGDVAAGHEPVGTRYRYAGAFGYESGLLSVQGANPDLPPITLQHLGARWYQPAIGRFVQRDPIGLGGGLNVYRYCNNGSLSYCDPAGLAQTVTGEVFGWIGAACGGIVGASAAAVITKNPVAAVGAASAGAAMGYTGGCASGDSVELCIRDWVSRPPKAPVPPPEEPRPGFPGLVDVGEGVQILDPGAFFP